jgi:hypothetical protein
VAGAEPGERDVVFAGTFEEVNEHFLRNLWSDGLPVVPPTVEKVEEFLKFTCIPAWRRRRCGTSRSTG